MTENFFLLGFGGLLLFSLAASTGYIFNDIVDRSSDRLSLRRNKRKLADQSVSITTALSLLVFLFLVQSLLWLYTPVPLVLALCVYLLLSFLYSVYFKYVRWIDVIFLSAFHTLRVVFGSVLFELPFDMWLVGSAFVGFFALALLKRLDEVNGDPVHARPYHVGHTKLLARLAVATTVVLFSILLMYVGGEYSKTTFGAPAILLLFIPLFSVWIAAWLNAATKGKIHNPIVFFFSQGSTYALIAGTLLILKGAN